MRQLVLLAPNFSCGVGETRESRSSTKAKGQKALRATERQRPLEEMRDTLLLPPLLETTIPGLHALLLERSVAPKQSSARPQKPEPSSLGGVFISLMLGSRRPWRRRGSGQASPTNHRRACACVHRRRDGVGSPRALRNREHAKQRPLSESSSATGGRERLSPRSRSCGPVPVSEVRVARRSAYLQPRSTSFRKLSQHVACCAPRRGPSSRACRRNCHRAARLVTSAGDCQEPWLLAQYARVTGPNDGRGTRFMQ